MKDTADPRATLDSVLQEARETPLADIDWASAEQRLLKELPAQPLSKPSAGGWVPWWAAALALGAVAALLVYGITPETASPSGAGASAALTSDFETTSSASEDLQVGQRMEAGERALVVRRRGVATWTLGPKSSGEVESLEPALVVELQSGFVKAEVVPSARAESFAIEVGRLRVAVRGTVFSVRRTGRHAEVDVLEGRVAVGVSGSEATSLLIAPAFARFVATGERAGEVLEQSGGVRSLARTRHTRTAVTAPAVSTPSALQQEPTEPTFEDVERAVAQVESALADCLKPEGGVAQDSVRFSLKTRVAFKVEASGATTSYRFVPPLAPALHACAQPRLAEVRFSASQVGVHVSRDLDIQAQRSD